MSDKERLEKIEKNLDPLGYGMGGHLISVNDIYWLVKYAREQTERVEELKKQLEQVKKAADFLLFQIGLARSESLIKAEFSGEEELYKALEGKE